MNGSSLIEVIKAAGMYAVTGAVSWVASRYHLDGQQTAAVMADAVGIATGATGVAMHLAAYRSAPPKA